MIEKFVDAVTTAGLDLTYDQVLDIVWLAGTLPKAPWDSLHLPDAGQPQPENSETAHPLGTKRETKDLTPPALPTLSKPSSNKDRKNGKLTSSRDPMPGGLYVARPKSSESGTMRAIPVRVPATEALPAKQGINAALRPLKRRFPSQRNFILDVTATVEQIANGGPSVPVLRAAPERWLEAALVVDDSISMRVWRDTIHEFELLLARHGSFRDVRTWYVNLDDGKLKLYSEAGLSNDPRRLRNPRELIDPSARRLILIVSDCVAEGWRNEAMLRAVLEWGRRGPVVLVQVLPERLWTATALGHATVLYRASSAASPNARLESQKSFFDLLRELDGIDIDGNLDEIAFNGLLQRLQKAAEAREWKMPLPVINLEGWSVAPWARLIANVGSATAEGVVARVSRQALQKKGEPVAAQEQNLAEADPETLLSRFRAAASPGARQLAGYLAVVPLCLPVMRLVQKAMMPTVRQVDLAEVLLSGLLEQETHAKQTGPAEEVFYRFYPGVRELLLNSVTQVEQKRILRSVSRLIEEITGTTISFGALLAGDRWATEHSREYPVGEKFAEVAAIVARRLQVADSEMRSEPVGSAVWDAPMRVYVAFASATYDMAKRVTYQLDGLEWNGVAEFWSAIDLRPQDMTAEVFRSRLDSANVFVPLLSGAYLESDWARTEIRNAIERNMLVYPMLLEPVNLEGHPLFSYFQNVAGNPFSSATDQLHEVAVFADRLRKEFRDRSLARIQESVVKVEVDNIFTCGFIADSDGKIVIFNTQQAAKTIEVTLWDKTSFMAEVQASDPEANLSIVRSLIPSKLDRAPDFAPWEKMLGSETIIVSPAGERWYGRIKTLDPELTLLTDKPLPQGIAGAPVFDIAGRIVALIGHSDISSGTYGCIRADRILRLMRTSSDPIVQPLPTTPVSNPIDDQTESKPRVLVVGTGTYELPARVQNAARMVGASVAVGGGTLITGGWEGVDYLAAEAFTAKGPADGANRLLNVLEAKDSPQFRGGKTIRVGRNKGIVEAVRNADLVILIGGAGGTWDAFLEALRARKPVLPFINTGTDAHHAGLLLEIFGQNVPSALIQMPFDDAVKPIYESELLSGLIYHWPDASRSAVRNDTLLWMAQDVLPIAKSYMAKQGHDHEVEVRKLFQQLRSKRLARTSRISLVRAFTADPLPEWRCIAYVALEAEPFTEAAAAMTESLDIEYTLARQQRETRPLWRCLSAIKSILSVRANRLPPSLFQQMNAILEGLSSLSNVDPGGECKRMLSEIVSRRGKLDIGSKTSPKTTERKKSGKTPEIQMSTTEVRKTPIKRAAKPAVKKLAQKAMKKATKKVTKKAAKKK